MFYETEKIILRCFNVIYYKRPDNAAAENTFPGNFAFACIHGIPGHVRYNRLRTIAEIHGKIELWNACTHYHFGFCSTISNVYVRLLLK